MKGLQRSSYTVQDVKVNRPLFSKKLGTQLNHIGISYLINYRED